MKGTSLIQSFFPSSRRATGLISSRLIKRVVGAAAMLVLMSACGNVVPDNIRGILSANESGSALVLKVNLSTNYDIPGCGTDLKISKDLDGDVMVVEVHGHPEPNEDDACASISPAQASFELPQLEVGESNRLEISLGDSVSSHEISRSEDSVTIMTLTPGDVNLLCDQYFGAELDCKDG